jgi:hypothetical protein
MIRLGVRLSVRGGRDAIVRLVITAVAVALGVGLLLACLAGINAVNTQNGRYAWLETSFAADSPTISGVAPATTTAVDPLWWLINADYFDGRIIGRVDVAATAPRSPVPPGIPALPGPGQFYASPAMSRLLRTTPYAELGARFAGRQIGTIGPSALPAPNSLIIVIGHPVAQLSHAPGASRVTAISQTPPSSCGNCVIGAGITSSGIDLILAVVGAGLLFPVLIFIGAATRLSATRRELRFAAMRLVGATPRQVAVIAAVESAVAAIAGTVAGFGVFVAIRPILTPIAFTGAPFFPSDLSLDPADIVLVAVGVPMAAALAARFALRRVQISPLGVSRRVTPQAPRATRLVPLMLGVGELCYFVVAGTPSTSRGQIEAYVPGLLLIMAGLVLAGPWLTMLGSRLMARRTSRPEVLIAGRRLADNPNAGFRAISGLVLALFVATTTVAIITTFVAHRGGSSGGASAADNLAEEFISPTSQGPVVIRSVAAGLSGRLEAIAGVRGVDVVHFPTAHVTDDPPFGFVSCAQLAHTPSLGRCPTGAGAVEVDPDTSHDKPGTVWPATDVTVAQLGALPVLSLTVATDGSTEAIERARTGLEQAYPTLVAPTTDAEDHAQSTRLIAAYEQLGNVVILVSLVIAGCSLAVSIAGGLSDRKRPFSLLRLTGVPIAMLRRVVALESAVPLLVAAVVSVGMGLLAAELFLVSQLGYTLRSPHPEFFAIVAAGLVASLGIIASTLPLLDRLTGPEVARND